MERRRETREEATRHRDDIDPLKFAGEGWFATDEYFPQDIGDKYVRGDVKNEGAYYPGPDKPRRRR